MHYHIRFTSKGIGDNIVAMTAVAALRRRHPDARITYATYEQVLPWLLPFTDPDAIVNLETPVGADKTYEPYPAVWDRELREQGKTLRHTIYAQALEQDEAAPPKMDVKPSRLAARFKGSVCLFPHAVWSSREWPMPHWLELDKRLHEDGWLTLAIGTRTMQTFAKRLNNLKPHKVIDVLAGCGVAVANDSGMAHLCGVMDVPCLVLCGGTKGETAHGFYPHTIPLTSDLHCTGCYWQGKFCVKECHTYCASLALLHPDNVYRMVAELLSGN